MTNTITVNALCNRLIGESVATNIGGHAGRDIENLIETSGLSINRGPGCDIKILGLEVKSRDLDATSPQTITTMTPDEICATPYHQSAVHEKFQQQLRVFTRDCKIVDAAVYDFSPLQIQDLVEEAYENGRKEIREIMLQQPGTKAPDYVYGSKYGYWERTSESTSYSFRINHGAFHTLEAMARSTFTDLFEYQ